MKIKEEKKVITQEQIIVTYISEDGKEYTDQKECERHETNLLRDKLEQKAYSLKHMYYEPPFADSYHSYHWFYVTNQEEVKAVEDYYNLDASIEIEFDIVTFPEWIGVEEGIDNDCYELGTLSQYQKSVSNMVDHFNEQAAI